ncbi:MAG: hypothetical protein R3B41_04255, partial [Candidatus Doudnabacteria bacterium]
YLAMPDLTRSDSGPIRELIDRITGLPIFDGFDVAEVPEIVPTSVAFDLFNFANDHVARSKSDTYYVSDDHILRPHTTVMWYYYLKHPQIVAKYQAGEPIKVLSYGKVYRKDELDKHHMNVFHQLDGLYLHKKDEQELTIDDLKNTLVDIAKAMYGEDIKYRFNKDTFPYTDPSIEMEVDKDGEWIEILGAGMAQGSVLKELGIDPEVYGGWAFGTGLERHAIISMELPDIRLLWSEDERVSKQLKLGQKYQEVSKYPPVIRDVSFIVSKTFVPNDYFDLIRELGGDLIEEVELTDEYENDQKFGSDRKSYTYRIHYRSLDHTLEATEIDPIQEQIYQQTAEQFDAEMR